MGFEAQMGFLNIWIIWASKAISRVENPIATSRRLSDRRRETHGFSREDHGKNGWGVPVTIFPQTKPIH
jgi:hypothetical protein